MSAFGGVPDVVWREVAKNHLDDDSFWTLIPLRTLN